MFIIIKLLFKYMYLFDILVTPSCVFSPPVLRQAQDVPHLDMVNLSNHSGSQVDKHFPLI